MNQLLLCAGHCWLSDREEPSTKDTISSQVETRGAVILPCLVHEPTNSEGTRRRK